MGGFVAKIIKPKPQPSFIQRAIAEAPRGPTRAELDDDKGRIGIKRRGRRATILTSTKGVDEDITLGEKTLLG